jgi:hypothetical protein
MHNYEYLAVPAPSKGIKVKGLKTATDRYAHQLTLLLNDLAAEGWEYWRADTLASEERKGFTGTKQVSHELLIFRRMSADALAAQMPQETYSDHYDAQEPAYASERAEPQLGSSEGYYEDQGPRLSAPSRD